MRVANLETRSFQLIPGAPLGVKDGALSASDRGFLVERVDGIPSRVDGGYLGVGRGNYFSNTYSSVAPSRLRILASNPRWHPFTIPTTIRCDEVIIFPASSTAGTFAFGIYGDDNYYPSDRLLQILAQDGSFSPKVSSISTKDFVRGLYWLCIHSSATLPFISVTAVNTLPILGHAPVSTANRGRTAYTATQSYVLGQDLPLVAPSGMTTVNNAPHPIILLRSL